MFAFYSISIRLNVIKMLFSETQCQHFAKLFKFFSDMRQDREKCFNTSLFFFNSRSARFSQTLFYVYGVFVYLSVCISVYHVYLVSAEAIIGHKSPGNGVIYVCEPLCGY